MTFLKCSVIQATTAVWDLTSRYSSLHSCARRDLSTATQAIVLLQAWWHWLIVIIWKLDGVW